MKVYGSEYRTRVLDSIQIVKDTFAAIEKFIPLFDQEFFQVEYLVSSLLIDKTLDITRVSSQQNENISFFGRLKQSSQMLEFQSLQQDLKKTFELQEKPSTISANVS